VRLIRRRTDGPPDGDGAEGATATGGSPDLVRDAHSTTGKGRPTPRRAEAQRRRTGPVPPPPRTRREAMRRQRELSAQRRSDGTARMRADDENALPRRDQGPERRLVRDIVDSRRNAGGAFLVMALAVLVTYVVPNTVVKAIVFYLWTAVFGLMVFDSVLIGLRIRKLVRERFPKSRESTLRLTLYGVNRTILPRRWRLPRPQVGLGERPESLGS
jgi:hypothetical protein